jgi:hypothetical protein
MAYAFNRDWIKAITHAVAAAVASVPAESGSK